MQKNRDKSKILYLEILRILAIFFVLYMHTGQRGKLHYQIAGMSASYYISMVLFCCAQMCIMLFLTISGALLLNREETLKQTLMRFLRMLLVVILFSIFQFFWTYLQIPEMGFDLFLCLKIMYSGAIITQYWYLYSYLGFLLLLPLLRILARNMDNQLYLFFFGIFIITDGLLPIIERLWGNNALYIIFPMNSQFIVAPFVGYFLAYRATEFWKQKKNLLLLNGVAVLALLLSVVEAHIAYQQNGDNERVLQGLIIIMVAAVFVDIKLFCEHIIIPKVLQKAILFSGNGVFGVYLLERQIKDNLVFIYDYMEPHTKWCIAVFCWLIVSMLLGIMLTNLLKKLPILRILL